MPYGLACQGDRRLANLDNQDLERVGHRQVQVNYLAPKPFSISCRIASPRLRILFANDQSSIAFTSAVVIMTGMR